MFEEIDFINKYQINNIKPLNKGWSQDQKYILENYKGDKYLLRISDKALFDKKKQQFELLQQIEKLDINCPKPIEFGCLNSGEVYIILSYLDGTDAVEAIKSISDDNAYLLGIEAGKMLKKIHQIKIHKQEYSWADRYLIKMERKINSLLNCKYKIPMQEEIVSYYKAHCYLIKNRPLQFTHGDFHLGNMIVKDGKLGIIDFDKSSIADPYDDFKPFCWNTMVSEYFETGLINGYFDNNIPKDFFSILKFYTAESLISQLPWATTFSSKEVETALEIANYQMIWYNNFKLEIPTWYKHFVKIDKKQILD